MPILFLLFWIILNGRVTAEVLIIGVFVSFLISMFAYRLPGISFAKEKQLWKTYGKHFFSYFVLLLKNVIISNFQMIKLILFPKTDMKPVLVYFESPVGSDFAKIMLTYSIMLTPGTVIFELEDNRFGVHAIDPKMATNINNSVFVQKLNKIEKRN